MKRFLLLLLVCVAAYATGPTTVMDTLYAADGITKFTGPLTVQWPTFQAADGHQQPAGFLRLQIVAGALNVALEPNDTATPAGTFYTVTYRLVNGIVMTEFWVVPTSGSPVNLATVRTAPPPVTSISIPLSQLSQSGATANQCVVWNGSSWVPQNCAGGGGTNNFQVSATSSTLSVASSGVLQCPAANYVISGTTTTAVRLAGSASETLWVGFSCTDQHLKLIAPTDTFTCTVSGFSACDTVTGSAFTSDIVRFASVALTSGAGSWTFGAVTDLRANFNQSFCSAGTGITITSTCTISATGGGSSTYTTSAGNTGAITMTGSDVTLYSVAGVPALAAGSCYVFDTALFNQAGAFGPSGVKLKVDGTQIMVLIGSAGGSGEADVLHFSYCNDPSVQNAQHANYMGGMGFCTTTCNVLSNVNFGLNIIGGNVPTAVDWSTSHTVSVTANVASGTITGLYFRIGQ